MTPTIIRIANKFASILRKKAGEDFLLKHPGKTESYIDPEMTEELDEIVKDSLHLVILMQRSMMDFMKSCEHATGEKKEMGGRFAEQVLFELQEIETNLNNSRLLEFILNSESGILDTIAGDIGMIRTALNLVRPHANEATPEAFQDLDLRVYKWLEELEENITKLADESMGQSEYMEEQFAVEPRKMREQVETDVDEIAREDIHPDYPDFEPEYGVMERELNPELKFQENRQKVKSHSNRWMPEGNHWVEKK